MDLKAHCICSTRIRSLAQSELPLGSHNDVYVVAQVQYNEFLNWMQYNIVHTVTNHNHWLSAWAVSAPSHFDNCCSQDNWITMQGWSYVGDRLLSAVIPYEESGWYDGQMWVKPPEVSLFYVKNFLHKYKSNTLCTDLIWAIIFVSMQKSFLLRIERTAQGALETQHFSKTTFKAVYSTQKKKEKENNLMNRR